MQTPDGHQSESKRKVSVKDKGEGKSSIPNKPDSDPKSTDENPVSSHHAGDIQEGLEDEASYLDGSAARVQAYQRDLEHALKNVELHEREWMEECSGFDDKCNFNKLFLHRHCCVSRWPNGRQLVHWLEVIASKLKYKRVDGEPGFFAKWVGWDETASLLAFSEWAMADSFIKCGIRASSNNPGWCRQTCFCPFCVCMLSLQAYLDAFGSNTGAFNNSKFIFATISWTDSSAKRRRSVYRALDEEDFDAANPASGLLRSQHSPRPFVADDGNQIEELRALARLQMQAIAHVYGKKMRMITGYRAKNEVAVTLDFTNRFLPNLHAILTTPDPGQHVADEVYDFILIGLEKLKKAGIVRRCIHPDVLLLLINSDEDLIRCMKYTDKAIDVVNAWREAANRPEALDQCVKLKTWYSRAMMESLLRLFDEVDDALPMPRSQAAGTMRFGTKAFIGIESPQHRAAREAQRLKAKQRRDRIIAEIKAEWPDPKDQRVQIRRRLGKKKKSDYSDHE